MRLKKMAACGLRHWEGMVAGFVTDGRLVAYLMFDVDIPWSMVSFWKEGHTKGVVFMMVVISCTL